MIHAVLAVIGAMILPYVDALWMKKFQWLFVLICSGILAMAAR